MNILFDSHSKKSEQIEKLVRELLQSVSTLESKLNASVIIFQDGACGAYYIKCSLLASDAAKLADLDAKLDLDNPDSYRANRILLTTNLTYMRMAQDAFKGREFSDIIVEYTKLYSPNKPLKVWGGQHRLSAISAVADKVNRYHGFRIYFDLSKEQRKDVALISNTNISVSNDTFDRMVEETMFGDALRKWCRKCGLLDKGQDFPDSGGRSETITVKRARSFVVNYYLGTEQGKNINSSDIDKRIYEPYLPTTGVDVDQKYAEVMKSHNIVEDNGLIESGKAFHRLHKAQYEAVTQSGGKIKNTKPFRNKAMIESVICGWSFVAGLLQHHLERLTRHYQLPRTSSRVPDPLNAEEMSKFKSDSDAVTYRGLGTRSALKDRQRIAQLFLAKSLHDGVILDEKFLKKAVSHLDGLIALSKGYI